MRAIAIFQLTMTVFFWCLFVKLGIDAILSAFADWNVVGAAGSALAAAWLFGRALMAPVSGER